MRSRRSVTLQGTCSFKWDSNLRLSLQPTLALLFPQDPSLMSLCTASRARVLVGGCLTVVLLHADASVREYPGTDVSWSTSSCRLP